MKTHLDALKERRKILQNPYAFADELDALQSMHRDRQRLENPYAHIDQVVKDARTIARFDGITQAQNVTRSAESRRTDVNIEQVVRQIQLGLWTKRRTFFGSEDIDPILVLDPLLALEDEGYQVLEAETLGQYATVDGTVEIAGSIDKSRKVVQFSRQFSISEQRFTLAHELAHAVLHESMSMHRDRPLDGSTIPVDPEEREANRFATFFLMPSKLVQKEFQERFGTSPVRFDERATFAGQIPRGVPLRRAAARRLATTTNHAGLGFPSLAKHFAVSTETMAIRLEELGMFILSNNLSIRGQR
jgi:Zn-dependent peptidase ImmA (M78 family)